MGFTSSVSELRSITTNRAMGKHGLCSAPSDSSSALRTGKPLSAHEASASAKQHADIDCKWPSEALALTWTAKDTLLYNIQPSTFLFLN